MDHAHEQLTEMLTRLKLTGIRDQLDSLLDEASRADMNLREALTMLCTREIARKDQRRIEMAMRMAKFPVARDLEGFDFAAQPSVDAKQIRELSASRWVANGENVLLLGPHGYRVLVVSAAVLVAQLAKAHINGTLEARIAHFAKPQLLIIDELGYLPFEVDAAHLLFQLVSRRYEAGAILLTSNRSVAEWGDVFGDAVVATAILDRLLHHSHIITIRGESYRLKEKRRSGLLSKPASATKSKPTKA
jgi:DNA replication protein DnaC